MAAIPRSTLVFALLHAAAAFVLVFAVFESRCVDESGVYGLDGCSIKYDPWREGDAPYVLASLALILGSLVAILAGGRAARLVLLISLAAYFAIGFRVSLRQTEDFLISTGQAHGWTSVFEEWSQYFVPEIWLFRIGLIAFDSWFLFGQPTRELFAKPPNKSLERTLER
ncbi:MAG: hypothetical protein WDO72_01930 [Pseudomonadota bacterium]